MTETTSQPSVKEVILGAGFPKTGNTMLSAAIQLAGTELDRRSQPEIYVINRIKSYGDLVPNELLSKNALTSYARTHQIKPFGKMPGGSNVKLTKVIRLNRNPLDTLLSFVNFTRFRWVISKTGKLDGPEKNYLTRVLGIDAEKLTKGYWVNEASLENMRDHGYLEKALRAFSNRGLVISALPQHYGSWSENYLSWGCADIDLHTIRYEDFISDKESGILKLANFLEVDEAHLRAGYDAQQEYVNDLKKKQTGSESRGVFFNKSTANYFPDYFEKSSVKKFIDKHWPILNACDYMDWCDSALEAVA